MNRCILHATPPLLHMLPCTGFVHSAFSHGAYIVLAKRNVHRLIALQMPSSGLVPDSICLPQDFLSSITEAMPVRLTADTLFVGTEYVPLLQQHIHPLMPIARNAVPHCHAFCHIAKRYGSGLHRMPANVRAKALHALVHGNAQAWLGLGPGLTPSFDDACVGAMAIYKAIGKACPLGPMDASVTTEVSARYLTLAMEGFFSQAVLDVIHCLLHNTQGLQRNMDALSRFGSTSGCDTLLGMRVALRHVQTHAHQMSSVSQS